MAFFTESEGRRMALSKEMEDAISKLPAEQQVSNGKGDERSMMIAEKKQQYNNQTLVTKISRRITSPTHQYHNPTVEDKTRK